MKNIQINITANRRNAYKKNRNVISFHTFPHGRLKRHQHIYIYVIRVKCIWLVRSICFTYIYDVHHHNMLMTSIHIKCRVNKQNPRMSCKHTSFMLGPLPDDGNHLNIHKKHIWYSISSIAHRRHNAVDFPSFRITPSFD